MGRMAAAGLAGRRWTALAVVGAALALGACDDDEGVTGPRPSLINDPISDFLASYTGPRNGDLDIRGAEVSYDGTAFVFIAGANALLETPGALYVWGVNRGSGTAGFPTLAPGVLFDAVVILQANGSGSVRDLATGVTTPLPVGSVSVVANEIRAFVPASLLPSRGFAPESYTVNIWPRVGTGNNNQISDFAPDNSNVPVRDER